MRIGTWNTEYARGADKNAARLRCIREAACDIWVLTETSNDLDLGPGYAHVSTEPRPGRRAGEQWTTIWSRYPIVERVPLADACRTVAALVASPLGALVVYGTVLPWHSDRGPERDAATRVPNWSEFNRVAPLQAAEWAALADARPDAHLCVAGDFNTSLGGKQDYGTKQGRELLRAGLRAARLACVTEWDRLPPGSLGRSPIDHIALSMPLAERSRVVSTWEGTDSSGLRMSDHSALVVEVM